MKERLDQELQCEMRAEEVLKAKGRFLDEKVTEVKLESVEALELQSQYNCVEYLPPVGQNSRNDGAPT